MRGDSSRGWRLLTFQFLVLDPCEAQEALSSGSLMDLYFPLIMFFLLLDLV